MTDTEKKKEEAKSQEPIAKSQQPTAAQVYHKLVHIKTTGWEGKKIVEHKEKCAKALAEKR